MAMRLTDQRAVPDAGLDRLYAAHAAATTYYRAQLHRNHGPSNYLRSRGLGAVVDRDAPWRIGFAPHAWTAIVDHLRGHGFTDAELLRGGLAFRSREGRLLDLFRDRIMFPLRNADGRIVGFTGRIWHPPTATDLPDMPKYLNSPDTSIYTKGDVLFGLAEQHDRIAMGWPPVIVEGPTDALAIWSAYASATRAGRVAVATCGTAVTAAQLNIATGLPGARRFGIAVAFDGDDAGHKAADRAYALLAAHHPDTTVRGARFTAEADPGDLANSAEGRARLRATLERQAQPLLHVVIDHRIDAMIRRTPQLLQEVPGQMALARSLAPLIAEQSPAAVVAAIDHVSDVAVERTRATPDGMRAAADTVHCLTFAVADYLETTPLPPIAARSAPGPPRRVHPAAAAFPVRPSAVTSVRTAATASISTIRGPVAPASSRRSR